MAAAVGPRAVLGAVAAGAVAVLTPLVAQHPHPQRHQPQRCPPGMTGTAVAALTEAGVPRRRIHYESFRF
jgi:hypothetical protein